ncbi:MAG TPA: TonB-dependent receptor [Bryobacteraceae bacterium]|nr:TonB-dependent receptor [Bryobacteraceae bacterium]
MTTNKCFKAVLLSLFFGAVCYAQSTGANSGAVHGSVVDPSGAAIKGAAVEIQNPVSHYDQTVLSDSQGHFEFDNVPYNNYHVSATANGFQTAHQDVDVRSPIAVDLKFSLQLGQSQTSITVTDAGDLLEADPTAHTDVDRGLFDKLPLESPSSSLSSLVTLSAPGVSADSNGLFHGLGDHAENSFSIDGEPITDQQSKVFSNQLPVDAVQSAEVIEGAPPAEYGGKTSLVIAVTTRSGLGLQRPQGELTTSYGTFGSTTGGANLAWGGSGWGNYISVSGLNTGRFLDGPEFATIHDHGNEQNVFDHIDLKPSASDTVSANLTFTRSWFQTPNSYDAQNATAWSGLIVDNGGLGPDGRPVGPQDQRSKIGTWNIAPSWTHQINSSSVFTLGGFARQDGYNYYPSANPFADLTPGLQGQTVTQDRTLTDLGLRASYSWVKGIHNLKIGGTYSDTILTEKDRFGIVDPTLNAPCLDSDGNAVTDPLLKDPAGCGPDLQANVGQGAVPAFSPLLACYDLTRIGPLPASDGCPGSAAGLYNYYGHANIHELGLYIEDTISVKNWTFNLGLRGDKYNGITSAGQAEPRLGIAYHVKPSNTVLRVSYARTMETPFNENLVLASTGCNDAVVNALMSSIGPCETNAPITPGHRNEFHAGLQQAFGRYFVLDGEYIWKYTHGAYDFSILGATPITFPIEWVSSKIPGYAIRATMPNFHGLSAYVVMSSVAARFFTPQVSGIGAVPGGVSVFRIDHDELFNATTHIQYQLGKRGPWIGLNWRYDSGLVAGPAPCAGGNCANGDAGSDNVVDASILTPDQQFEAGLHCGTVYATPTTSISPDSTCPASQYGSKYLQIPAPGTENDDHNPPRIAPRNLFDLAIGHDNLFHGDRYKFSARVTIVNLTNKEALYNFLSTFSGTHYVTPRTVTASIGFHF